MLQAGRERVDLQPRRCDRRLPVGPAARRRHLERRDAALRLRRRDHRRAAPGRLLRDAPQPAPQQRGAADQRDDARKNAREAHEIAWSIANTLSDVNPPRDVHSGVRCGCHADARIGVLQARISKPPPGDLKTKESIRCWPNIESSDHCFDGSSCDINCLRYEAGLAMLIEKFDAYGEVLQDAAGGKREAATTASGAAQPHRSIRVLAARRDHHFGPGHIYNPASPASEFPNAGETRSSATAVAQGGDTHGGVER